jgi:exopolysaccharide production protein ExoZ
MEAWRHGGNKLVDCTENYMGKITERTFNERLEPLDWLRGLMALSIMAYHFSMRSDAAHPIGRLGIYGVCIFFILSGLSMAIAYDRYIRDVRTSIKFFIRRLFRIWPLLWLAVALVAIPTYLTGKGPFGGGAYGAFQVFLNITTLAGFDDANGYINVGAWSIGNEMFYYLFTPIFIVIYRWKKLMGNFVMFMSALISVYFAFFMLSPKSTLADQFSTYANPYNHIFLYCSGLALYYNFRNLQVRAQWHWPCCLLASALFFIYPASGDQINIVTGYNRFAMAFISILIVLAFYKCAPILPRYVSGILVRLGVATYGVYLLHPIIGWYVTSGFNMLEQYFMIQKIKYIRTLVSIPLTIGMALLTYRYLEAPLITLGKRLTESRSGMNAQHQMVSSP